MVSPEAVESQQPFTLVIPLSPIPPELAGPIDEPARGFFMVELMGQMLLPRRLSQLLCITDLRDIVVDIRDAAADTAVAEVQIRQLRSQQSVAALARLYNEEGFTISLPHHPGQSMHQQSQQAAAAAAATATAATATTAPPLATATQQPPNHQRL